jgi:hypothetical protein
MSKTSPVVSLSFVVFLLCALCLFVTRSATDLPAAELSKTSEHAPGQAKDPNSGPAAPAAREASTVVARIGEYAITRGELEERLVREIQPHEEDYIEEDKPVTAEATLRTMIAEKAMSMEGRKLGYLKDEMIHSSIEELRQRWLAGAVLENYVHEHVSGEASEVDRMVKEKPSLSREQATSLVQQAAASKLLESFYKGLTEKFHLKKVESNLAQAAQIHQRLLRRPVEPRGPGEFWIKNSQVKNELSDKEKNLVLATYEGGQFTLKDWFQVLCNIAPPRRPDDLSTPAGVERLLDRALRAPILVAEAQSRGFDKDEKLRAEIRQLEDQRLLDKVQEEKMKSVAEPAAEQVRAYFEKNKEKFAQPATLKIDPIWCESLETARKLKASVGSEGSFETLKKTYSLRKDESPYRVSAAGEGPFWADLWKGEPNQTLGPMRGFWGSGVKWRIVRVLEKTPAKVQPYSEPMATRVKWAMMGEQRRRILEDYCKVLLEQYPHEIFRDTIKNMDPLEIAMTRENQGMR